MEGVGATKRVVVVMMLLLAVVVVQAQEVSPPHPSASGDEKLKFNCLLKCGAECFTKQKFKSISEYAFCLTICQIRCNQLQPNAVVLGCTEKCVVSKITALKPESFDEVESHMDSCYDGCSNKNIVGHGF